MNFNFEPLSKEYADSVMDIFNYYIENSYAAYFEKKLPYEFFNNFLQMTKGYPSYVIKSEAGKVIGFCFLRAYSPLPTFGQTAEITYFIEKDEVGKGVGKAALELLEKEGKNIGIVNILASISSFNEGSIRFHKKNGFTECGRFSQVGNKNGKHFDVVWMQKNIC